MKADFRSLANASIRNITPYQPGKPIAELERELGITSSIKLASNENPLGASPHALAAARTALMQAHIYPDGSYYDLKQALAKFISVAPEQITVGNGSENLLELIIKSYLREGDNAVISEYAFLTIPILINSYGAHIKVAPAHQYGHDHQAMIDAIDEKTRILFLVNPNNPTGTYVNEDNFRALMNTVPAHVLVVVDEAYSEYIDKPDYPDTLSHLKKYPNLIISRTFSKVYGLAALRIGYTITSLEIADMLNRARLPFNVNTIAATAAIAALEDQEHVIKSVLQNQAGLRQLETVLNELGIEYIPSIGNFITLNVGDGQVVYQQLLYEGVIVRPLHAYQLPKHIRVTIGTPENMERCITALKKVLTNLSHQAQPAMESIHD